MPTTKDDPLDTGQTNFGGRTIWLDRDNVLTARDNYWAAYQKHAEAADKDAWDLAWAAAIAAYSYLMEGRLEPR